MPRPIKHRPLLLEAMEQRALFLNQPLGAASTSPVATPPPARSSSTGGAQRARCGPPLAGRVSAPVSDEGVMSIGAAGADDTAYRFSWEPGDAGLWNLEDLTALAD